MRLIPVLVGPAGSGKSTLAAAYLAWLREGGADACVANFDPAAVTLPYEPGFDVRRYVDAREIAKKYGLGPNGALVKAVEIAAEKLPDMLGELDGCASEYIIVDTPGQMEVFLFRDIAWKLSEALQKLGTVYAFFVLDAEMLKRPEDYGFLLVMATSVAMRLGVETAPVINKADLAPATPFTGDTLRDFGKLSKMLKKSHSLYAELLRDLLKTLLAYSRNVDVPRVSALRREGLEELHRLLLEMGCSCGDLS